MMKKFKKAFQEWAVEYVKMCDLNGNSRFVL